MKWLIASDLHGSAYAAGRLLEALDREGASRLLLLGDLLYHGPRNDLPQGYDPKAVAACLNARAGQIACVRGNCDSEVDQMMLRFPILADTCLLDLGGRLLYAAHGHHDLPPLQAGDLFLCGHTHVPEKRFDGRLWRLNPGSVSLPKGGSAPGYMTLEDGVFRWKTLAGQAYDELQGGETA